MNLKTTSGSTPESLSSVLRLLLIAWIPSCGTFALSNSLLKVRVMGFELEILSKSNLR